VSGAVPLVGEPAATATGAVFGGVVKLSGVEPDAGDVAELFDASADVTR
jgi:hypothetical protein